MKIVKKLVRNLIWWANNDEKTVGQTEKMSVGPSSRFDRNPIRISVHFATGGVIVEASCYSPRLPSQNDELFVLTDTSTLGEELQRVITMMEMRR